MEKIKEFLKRPLITGLAGLVIGLIIGLPLLGWGLFPVQWKDADASLLRQDLRDQYRCMVIDSYKVNKNIELLIARFDSLGVEVGDIPGAVTNVADGGCNYPADDKVIVALKGSLLEKMQTGPGYQAETPVPQATQVPASEPREKSKTGLILILAALFLAIGAALAYIFLIRNRQNREPVPPDLEGEEDYLQEEEQEYAGTPIKTIPSPKLPEDGPVAHFMTSYVIGDDLYDDSFSIDGPTGEFLGECGVGISDTIGVGDPKKVSAFEVWLFDKNDIQTVTKVLMSTHAMNDNGIRQGLASKGEPILLEPGQQILLETATLQLEARVIEMVYGQGALPPGSFFERLTLEISVFQK